MYDLFSTQTPRLQVRHAPGNPLLTTPTGCHGNWDLCCQWLDTSHTSSPCLISHPSGSLLSMLCFAAWCPHVTQQKAFVRLRLQLLRFPASAELLLGSAKGIKILAAWWIQNCSWHYWSEVPVIVHIHSHSRIYVYIIWVCTYNIYIYIHLCSVEKTGWTRVLDFAFFLRKVM